MGIMDFVNSWTSFLEALKMTAEQVDDLISEFSAAAVRDGTWQELARKQDNKADEE